MAPKLAVPNAPPSAAALIAPPDRGARVPSRATLSVLVSDPQEQRMKVSFYGRPTGLPVPDGEDFTIVALPDTQYYSESFPEIFVDQTRWIVENRAAMNIVYVAHLGDIVEVWNEANRYQFKNADAALSLLEGETPVPYGLAAGNHDGAPSETRLFNEFFGVDRFESRPWYGGHYQENNDNHYDLFTAGGMDFIAIYFEFTTQSHGDVLRWADKILNRYHDRRAIVVSHYLINYGDPARWSETGRAIYDALKDNPNLFLMLCGHIHREGYRFETFNGNGVHVVLSDYQFRSNGGDGWLRLYRFSPVQNTISVFTYSPWRDEYERDADSEFVLSYDMSKPTFERVARVRRVESDTEVTVEWPDRSPCGRYEWYATATDGTTPTTGPVWRFTVDGAGGPSPCDTNCDGVVDAQDISPFIDLLEGRGTQCSLCAGDTNGDGLIDAFDIGPFLECLFP